MSKKPAKRRAALVPRPPRYDRIQELAAFHLGYRPYELWYHFVQKQEDEPPPECQRWLLDIPIMLWRQLPVDHLVRYKATTYEVLALLAAQPATVKGIDFSHSVEIEDETQVKARIKAAFELASKGDPGAPQPTSPSDGNFPAHIDEDSDETQCSVPADESDDPDALDDPGNDLAASKQWALSERQWYLIQQRIYQANEVGHVLIRLVAGIGDNLPEHLKRWFKVGKTIGQSLFNLTKEHYDPAFNIRQEILAAAAATDFDNNEAVPDVSLKTYRLKKEITNSPADDGYYLWASDRLEKLVKEVDSHLSNDAPIVLAVSHQYLWFLGTYVALTTSETNILRVAAESSEDIIPRWRVLKEGLDDPTISEEHVPDNQRKADQWVHQILEKIVSELERIGSPCFRVGKKDTTNWLREQLLIPVRGVGWQRGPLLKRMIVKP
jgi:hypothetical protein